MIEFTLAFVSRRQSMFCASHPYLFVLMRYARWRHVLEQNLASLRGGLPHCLQGITAGDVAGTLSASCRLTCVRAYDILRLRKVAK
jgi:hypothetical protein